MMRALLILALPPAVAACGQTGSLYLPDASVETPVEIHTTETPAPASAPQPEPEQKDEDKKATPPPGR
jgi:predicted small lipoprotein YifL